jgi:upstream activation factor subunit UAF30
MDYSKNLMKPLDPNNVLALIVGSEPLARTQIIKKVWAYIKEHGLQDLTNRRVIKADEKLLTIFDGKKQVTMFEVTTQINKHLSEYVIKDR